MLQLSGMNIYLAWMLQADMSCSYSLDQACSLKGEAWLVISLAALAIAAAGVTGDGAVVQSVHVQSEGGLKERSIKQLSGGERRRVALALALGFADLTAGRGQLHCNLIVLDEVKH